MRHLLLPSLLVFLLCTCDRAPETLFVLRTDTGVTSANMLRETEDFNIVEYLYYYNGGGVAATDINGDGLPDLYFTNNQGPNKLYLNRGDFKFEEQPGAAAGAGDWSTGISVVDVDQNGLMDIYVCNVSGYKGLRGRNELFLQNQDGSFTESAAAYGLDFPGFNTQVYWFDYDPDGDLDMYLLRHSVHNDATYGTAEGRYTRDSLAGDLLLRNDSKVTQNYSGQKMRTPHFTDVTELANLYSSKIGYGLSASVADLNQDGYPDIYVCNDFSENDYYYVNQGDGTFRESVRDAMGHTSNFSMGSDAGDLDGDGRPDLFTLDMRPWDESILKATMSADQPNVYNLKRKLGYHDQLPHNALHWNRGGGNFSEVAEMAGVAASDWSWSCLIEDFDLDGRPDIFVANGIERRPNSLDYLKFISARQSRSASNLEVIANMPGGHVANRLFRGTGELAFMDVAPDWGLDLVGSSTGAATADLDGDGDLDLVLNNLNAPATVYENTAADGTVPAERLQPEYNQTPLAAQRGMMSQSGPAEVHIAVVPPPEENKFLVRGSGVKREPVPNNYFNYEPLSLYEPYPESTALKYLGERKGATYWQDDNGKETQRYRWDGAQFIPVAETAEPLVFNAAEARFQSIQAQTMVAGADGFLRTETMIDSALMKDPDYPVRGDVQSVTRLNFGPETEELIIGRLGLNTVLGQPTPEEPVRLYLADVDGNGKADPIVTYVRNGREVTVADKDELTGQLPSLRRNKLSYTDFAQRSFLENVPVGEVEPVIASSLHHVVQSVSPDNAYAVDTLPRATQITTLNTALQIPQGILLGGNKLRMLPRIGRQDAAALQLLRPDGTVDFIDLGGARNRSEVRQLLRLDDTHVLVVVAEGEHLILSWEVE